MSRTYQIVHETRQVVELVTEGPAGKSAYQSWLDAGNTGTEADFLADLAVGGAVADPGDLAALFQSS